MKSKLTLVGLLATILTGCSNDDVLSVTEKLTDGDLCETAVSQNVKAITNYISKHHASISRSAEELIYPYIVDGDTVMYIANYGDGWEVFSNDLRTPMVLMKCDEGDFYPTALNTESPFEDLFQNTAEYLNSLKKADFAPTDTINSEWLAYGIEPLSSSNETDDEYYWKYVASSPEEITTTEYMPSGKRLVTKWRQGEYFSLCTPFISGAHAPLGCTAVAVGQYLYYTHYKDNRPEKTVTEAKYNQTKNSYEFSGSSSTVWDSFATYHIYDSTYMTPTAIFLGWVAQKLNTQFSASGSSSTLNQASSFLNSQTKLNTSVTTYSPSSVVEILEKDYPVYTVASTANDEGHAFLIDYYKAVHSKSYNYYIYVKRVHGSNPDDEDELDGDFMENPNVENIKEAFGDVPVNVERTISVKPYIKCNWGWGGTSDEIEIDARTVTWSANGITFTKNQKIIYLK